MQAQKPKRGRGRPPKPAEQVATERAEVRMTRAERAKFDALGGAEWVRHQIALAELPAA